ncbi:MAG TPA: alpha,alpha-trehalase TreA [Gemmatimonadales bacterium]|nr:alpha,alpha-trehalase TreA [Gemmatimonadales bacterium]
MKRRCVVRGASCVVLALGLACRPSARPPARPSAYDPAHDIGTLFADVQLAGIFPDSKEFVDARPKAAPAVVAARYDSARRTNGFVLRTFVDQNFILPRPAGDGYHTVAAQGMLDHVKSLWPVLTRSPDSTDPRSSLIPLSRPYVVPGGRFREIYYWDSYFTMLGLVQSGRTDLVKDMLDNFAQLIGTLGHIPNGNRTYYRTRSQPPYFAAMVGLYARATDTSQALAYLDALEREHAFWMEGADSVQPGQAHRRVVRLASGVVVNRYWDDSNEPRPESYRPDVEIGQTVPESLRSNFYRNARATAESGWDFSSRWMRNPKDLRTLETIELIPVDLNSLLYNAERTIAALRRFRHDTGDADIAQRYTQQADARRDAILAMYDPNQGFFFDRRWRTGELVTDRPSLAAAEPLYFGIASADQGKRVAARLERDFLKPGGFVTTNFPSGQQWDAPNGWPPLEWLTIEGVRRYGRADLADKAAGRWLAIIQRTYQTTGRMMEKYDVVNLSKKAGGGEYPTQDGFGWTNGVALALCAEPAATHAPACKR